MKSLKLEHLAGYLPYGLKFHIPNDDFSEVQTLTGLSIEDGIQTDYNKPTETGTIGNYWAFSGDRNYHFYKVKPILHPLSDLTEKELRENGFWHHIDFLTVEKGMPIHAPYEMVVYLFSKHYDVFGLIEQNLAIDINTLNPKP